MTYLLELRKADPRQRPLRFGNAPCFRFPNRDGAGSRTLPGRIADLAPGFRRVSEGSPNVLQVC